ncbi:muts domain V-domain-containing protein [Lipomyces arxii]|uniref:muts domain V-domain-containing protein n=1 Tax=Lipomyces arxii TaxID=56418 RepID=UPI0034CFEFF7
MSHGASRATSRAQSRAQSRASYHSARVICAITESRGVAATVGLCFVSVDTGECVLCEIADSQTYVRTIHKLGVYDPSEILLPQTCISPPSKLCSIIYENIAGAKITGANRRAFNEAEGLEYIAQLTIPRDAESIRILISAKFYAVCAMAAALKHVETALSMTFAAHSLRIRYEASEGSMLIDSSSVRSLELIQNLVSAQSQQSLLGFLNKTATPMGLRLLRANILQPLTDVDTINLRLDALDELTQSEELFFACQTVLKPFQDVDRLVTALITVPTKTSIKHSEQRVNDLILLKQSVLSLVPVASALVSTRSPLLRAIRDLCAHESIAVSLINLIDNYINPDCQWAKTAVQLRNQRCFAVRTGANGLLDVARQTYKEITEDLMQLVEQIKTEANLTGLETRFEIARGYYLRVPQSDDLQLSGVFINQVARRKFIEFSTMEMLKLNAKLRDSLVEIMLMSETTVEELIERVRDHVPALYKACEGLAMLDMLVSLASVATASPRSYVRPTFGDLLAIKNARHAVKEVSMAKNKRQFVANDVYAHPDTCRFQIITGTNMSGKSTYLKQVAVLCIMAQFGSYVPAEQATFPIYRSLHSRASTDDESDSDSSAFATDMREASFVLQHASAESLLIIDEMARGSSVRDGLAIALAISETLAGTGATILFATHFPEISQVLGNRIGVSSLHMQVDSQEKSMKMLYKISDGRNVTNEHYGLKLARVMPFPIMMIDRADFIARLFSEQAKIKQEAGVAWRRRTLLELLTSLKAVENFCRNGIDDKVLERWLWRLQIEFITRMA